MDFIQFISQIGFPGAACVAMGWYVKYITDQNNKRLDEYQEKHSEEMNRAIEVVQNNTIAITKLCERINNNENYINDRD